MRAAKNRVSACTISFHAVLPRKPRGRGSWAATANILAWAQGPRTADEHAPTVKGQQQGGAARGCGHVQRGEGGGACGRSHAPGKAPAAAPGCQRLHKGRHGVAGQAGMPQSGTNALECAPRAGLKGQFPCLPTACQHTWMTGALPLEAASRSREVPAGHSASTACTASAADLQPGGSRKVTRTRGGDVAGWQRKLQA